MSYRSVLTNPQPFFREQQQDPDRHLVLLILLAAGFVPLIAQLSLTSAIVIESENSLTLSYVVGGETAQVAVSAVGSSLASFASALVYWTVAAVGAYLLTTPVSDSGDLRTTLWIVGWGFVPPLFSGVLWLLAMIVSIQATPTPTTVAASSEFVRAVQQTQLVRATHYLDYGVILWAGGLWTVGVKAVREVTWWQAVLAAIPGVAIQLAPYLLL